MHTLGYPCRIEDIVKICDDYNIPVVEDAAEALGATYKNAKIGLHGDCSCFSFYANKHITTGEGGMILTDDNYYADILRSMRA